MFLGIVAWFVSVVLCFSAMIFAHAMGQVSITNPHENRAWLFVCAVALLIAAFCVARYL